MAWLPISTVVPQYTSSTSPYAPYSGAVLKAYAKNTSTNIPFALDSVATATANSIALNAAGFPEVSGNVVIPHLDQDYKLALYPTQAAADSDSGAIWTIDNIQLTGLDESTPVVEGNITVWPVSSLSGGHFDGSNDYLLRNSALDSAVAGKKGTLVCVVTFDNSATTDEYLIHSDADKFYLRRSADGTIRLQAENSAGSTILDIATSNAYNDVGTQYVITASWDMATPGSGQIYVNNTADVVTTTFANDSLDYAAASWAVGATTAGANKFAGNIYHVYLNTTDNIDFSVQTNRQLVFDDSNSIVYMGNQGQQLTGNQPAIFLGNRDTDSLIFNRGFGGDFSLTGALDATTIEVLGQYADDTLGDPILSETLTNIASLDFTDLSSEYLAYKIYLRDFLPVNNTVNLLTRVSTDNGATFNTTAAYTSLFVYGVVSGSVTLSGSAGQTSGSMTFQQSNTATTDEASVEITIWNPADSSKLMHIQSLSQYINASSNWTVGQSSVRFGTGADINAIQFYFTSGNISTVTYSVYGIRK